MIRVYTDITQIPKTQKALSACIILSDTEFYGCFIDNLVGSNTLLLELEAVIKSAEHVQRVIGDAKNVTIFCDNPETVTAINRRKRRLVAYSAQVSKLLSEIPIDYNYEHVKAHQNEINPNKVVDYIANSTMRIQQKT